MWIWPDLQLFGCVAGEKRGIRNQCLYAFLKIRRPLLAAVGVLEQTTSDAIHHLLSTLAHSVQTLDILLSTTLLLSSTFAL